MARIIVKFLLWLTWLCCWLFFIQQARADLANNLPSVLSKKTETSQQVSAKELDKALEPLIKLLENQQQQQQLLTQLQQLKQATQLVVAQGAQHSIQEHLDSWLFQIMPRLKKSFTSWQKHFDAAQDVWGREQSSLLLLGLLALLLAIVPFMLLRVWLKRFLTYVLNTNTFDKSSRLSTLFSAHYMQRVGRYVVKYILPLLVLLLISKYCGQYFFIVNGPKLDLNLLWYTIICLVNASLLTLLLASLFPLLAHSKEKTIKRRFQRRLLRYCFIISWLFAWENIVTHPQLIAVFGADLMFIVRTWLNFCLLIVVGWLIFAAKPVITFLLNYQTYLERKNKIKKPYFRNILAVSWFIPLLFLVVLSLISIVLGDDNGIVLNRSIFSSLITFFAITIYVLLGHLIRIKEDYQILTVHQEMVNRMHRFFLVLLRVLLIFLFAEILIGLWGYSFAQLEEFVELSLIRPVLLIFVVCSIGWLLIIALDNIVQQYIFGGASARVQTILPLINVILKTVVVLIGVIVLMSGLGLNITPLLAGAGILGLAIGFGAQSLVTDIITGIFILIEDSISVGDYIAAANHEGTVEQLTLRTVSLRDLEGVLHVIPFSQIKGVKNYSREIGYSVMRVPVPYATSIDKVIELVEQSVKDVRHSSAVAQYIWSGVEMQGVESFESGLAILRFRIETVPFRQWQVMRFIYLDLKRRFEKNNIAWAVPYMNFANTGSDANLPAKTHPAPGQATKGQNNHI